MMIRDGEADMMEGIRILIDAGAPSEQMIAHLLEHRGYLLLLDADPMCDMAIRQAELLLVELGLSMAEAPDTMCEYREGREFVRQARAILEKLGDGTSPSIIRQYTDDSLQIEHLSSGIRQYEDSWVKITSRGDLLQIERLATSVADGERNSHLRVSNPTTMVLGDEIIRHHGEHEHIARHIRNIYETIA